MSRLILAVAWVSAAACAIALTLRLQSGGSLAVHMVGHVFLADVVALVLVLALPRSFRTSLVDVIDRTAARAGVRARIARGIRSPIVVLAAWTIVLSALMSPWGHAWSRTGSGELAEPLLLVAVGLCFWRVTIDQHQSNAFVPALVHGGLAWWGRHIFAVAGRVSLLPAIMLLWYAPAGSYTGASTTDQGRAAAVVLGSEMTLFGLACVLFLILVVAAGPGELEHSRAEFPYGV